MNNGRGSQLNAREFTAEIERETSLASNREPSQREVVPDAGSAQELSQPRRLEVGQNVLSAVGEIARDEAELEHPLAFVGEESKLQETERLADDAEDLQSEEGEGLKFVSEIVNKSQEAVAQAIVPEVNKIVNNKSFRPADLMKLYRHGVNKTLASFNRRIGERN